MDYFNEYLNRTLCDVLEEMRTCFKTYNFAPMLALIEEAQMMGNKMEAGLNDKHDVEKMENRKKELVKEIRELRKKREALSGDD
jgi:hypothetical protein